MKSAQGVGLDLIFHAPTTPMDSDTYPGMGLSLPQLVFALKKELNHTTRLPLYVEGTFRARRRMTR